MPDTEQFQPDRDISFEVDLSGIQAPTGQSNVAVPEGYYKALVDDMYINKAGKNPDRFIIKLKIEDAPYTGVTRTTGLGIPKDKDDKVRYYWRGFAESVGFDAADLDKGAVTLKPAIFKGKVAHIRYAPKEEGNKDKAYEKIDFLPPVEWAQQKQAFDASAPRAAKAPELGETASAPTLDSVKKGTGSTMTRGDILGKLGLPS